MTVAPWHQAGTGARARLGGTTHRHSSPVPQQRLEEECNREMGGKPQILGSVLPPPTGEGGGRRMWQLPGSKGAALQLHGLQKAAGQPSGLVKAKPLCLH